MRTPGAKGVTKVGFPPGSVIYTGKERTGRAVVRLLIYGKESCREELVDPSATALTTTQADDHVTWINVDGVHDVESVIAVGDALGIHRLALEDVANVKGRPHLTDYGDQLALHLKMLSLDEDGAIQSEHVSLILGDGWVLSFQERQGDVFELVRDRIRNGAGTVRSRRSDYLWYALFDSIVDHYMIVTDYLRERVDDLQEVVWESETGDFASLVQDVRREVASARRAVRPIPAAVRVLRANSPTFVGSDIQVYFADLESHVLHVVDSIDGINDALSSLMDAHLSVLSTRANEVMRVLTIMASVFIPLTFLAGVYGMNFEHMPELHLRWAYPAVWGVMLVSAGAMLRYFHRKNWL